MLPGPTWSAAATISTRHKEEAGLATGNAKRYGSSGLPRAKKVGSAGRASSLASLTSCAAAWILAGRAARFIHPQPPVFAALQPEDFRHAVLEGSSVDYHVS